jgi:hypothetical protein
LGKSFKGLDPKIYEKHFENVQDPHLRERALSSLKRAGQEQEDLYDFSMNPLDPFDVELGLLALLPHEITTLTPYVQKFLELLSGKTVIVMLFTYI